MGIVLQILVVTLSLFNTWLLSRKGKERWGYLAGLLTLPFWVAMEFYYHQWFFFCLNPIYFALWGKGVYNHWGAEKWLRPTHFVVRISTFLSVSWMGLFAKKVVGKFQLLAIWTKRLEWRRRFTRLYMLVLGSQMKTK